MARTASNLWLVVEDDSNDFALLERACRRITPPPTLLHFENGSAAQTYLASVLDRGSPDLPALILSDIKMPRMDGFELLAWIRDHQTLFATPFIIITGSDMQVDRDRARALRADGYLVKPSGLPILVEAVEALMRGDSPQ
jgi:two-component system, chemotaxis family, response regulator Rcp1